MVTLVQKAVTRDGEQLQTGSGFVLSFLKHCFPPCKNYLVKMVTSAWLLPFQGSLYRLVVAWLKEFQNMIIIHQPITIPSSFKELAQTLVC